MSPRLRQPIPMRGMPQLDNLVLAALPSRDLTSLGPALKLIPLHLKQTLERPGEPIETIIFPAAGFCSLLIVLSDGGAVEVANVGQEGVIGIHAALSDRPSLCTSVVQAEGSGYRMDLDVFRRELEKGGPFHELMTRYSDALTGSIMQTTACNAAHKLEQRLSRWLLTVHDRIGPEDFPLTQEFAAIMLGVTRPTMTTVAGMLQKTGLITYRHGRVRIVDREGLEGASCECYAAIKQLLENSRQPSRIAQK